MSEILRLENVIKLYGANRAVNGVDLTINAGDIALIQGESGCGKTTLLRLICGMERPSDGKVYVMDEDIYALSEVKRAKFRNINIGVVASKFMGLLDEYTVLENVALPLEIAGLTKVGRESRAKEMLDIFGISNIASAKPKNLFMIERRLTAMAKALITKPKLLLVDELTFGLAGRERELVVNKLENNVDMDTTVILLFSSGRYDGKYTKSFDMHEGKVVEL